MSFTVPSIDFDLVDWELKSTDETGAVYEGVHEFDGRVFILYKFLSWQGRVVHCISFNNLSVSAPKIVSNDESQVD